MIDEPDITIRRALLLSLGEFDDKALPPEARKALLPQLQDMYRTDPDPGLHAAAEWLLRQWKQDVAAKSQRRLASGACVACKTDSRRCNDENASATRFSHAERNHPMIPTTRHTPPTPSWYVNSQGQTMVVIPGPRGVPHGIAADGSRPTVTMSCNTSEGSVAASPWPPSR